MYKFLSLPFLHIYFFWGLWSIQYLLETIICLYFCIFPISLFIAISFYMLPFSAPRSFLSLNYKTSENLCDHLLQVLRHQHTHRYKQYTPVTSFYYCSFLKLRIFRKSHLYNHVLIILFSLLFVMYSCKLHGGWKNICFIP